MGDNTKLVKHHEAITDKIEDQLCLADMHYIRSHFQEATDIYKVPPPPRTLQQHSPCTSCVDTTPCSPFFRNTRVFPRKVDTEDGSSDEGVLTLHAGV